MTSGIKKIRVGPSAASLAGNWRPDNKGAVLASLLDVNTTLTDDEKSRLVEETTSILSACVNPHEHIEQVVNTGLVIGYVQSGKTLSFTSLMAMAQDNGYRLIILLAGVNNNLVEQSYERLVDDLKVNKTRSWNLFTTQKNAFKKGEVERVNTELDKQRRCSPRAKTVLIISMKHHTHLKNLTQLLTHLTFSNIPTLIIDDEGDQASMNTMARRGDESPTHVQIKRFRNLFPLHSYILYTATPQAPLLIRRIDTLSPDFGRILTPGVDYVGGKEFFIDGVGKYINLIPSDDVISIDEPPSAPPGSLLDALRDFFVGVSIGLCKSQSDGSRNRSMMIHPGTTIKEHLMFARWVKYIKKHWTCVLQDTSNPSYHELLEDFRQSAQGILATYNTPLKFDDIAGVLVEAIQETVIEELNTRERASISPVKWSSEYSWILVGGIGLDRGVTLAGLTVSYMPRSVGVGNADNIQQRARFFGYKRSYLGLCRIYLTEENIDAFMYYVDHEESIRNSIRNYLNEGKTLKEWRRTFPLDHSLKPTRSSVIMLKMRSATGPKNWVIPAHPFENSRVVEGNRSLVRRILDAFEFEPYAMPGWNDNEIIPLFSDKILLVDIMPLIRQFNYHRTNDSLKHSALMLSIERLVAEDPCVKCSFYAFPGSWSNISSKRSLTKNAHPRIKNLFQGRNKRTNYPGARNIVSRNFISFQLHRYDIQTADKTQTFEDVPILATYIPDPLMTRINFWVENRAD